ncbi:MAG: hypothetical protein QM820_58995 [Minicystis sp.]
MTTRRSKTSLAKSTPPVREKDFYRAAERALHAWAQATGFAPGPDRGHWRKRLAADLELTIWIQVDKHGWSAAHGSKFTVNFELVRDASAGSEPGRMSARYGDLLDSIDEDAFAAIAESVRARLPPPEQGEDAAAELPAIDMSLREGDPWMSYYVVEDAVRWCTEFLAPRFERMIATLLEGGRDRLPAGIETLVMPGLAVGKEGSSVIVSLPRDRAGDLRAWIERAQPGAAVVLRGEGLVVVLGAALMRRGSISDVRRVGLTELRRVNWQVGTGAVACLSGILAGESREPVALMETFGEIVRPAGIAIALS